jgi:5-methyltetrahydrofolate--homocysteine methyltransferase
MGAILEDLRTKRALVADGGWGTFLIAEGMQPGECPELWNVNRPDFVRRIAEMYVEAGSDLVSTNSFGGTRVKLDQHGVGDRAVELNEAAAALTRQAVGPNGHVLASIGPTGKFLITGEIEEETMYDAFKEQAMALERGGADACIVETMAALDEACVAIRAVKENTKLEIVCSFTYSANVGGVHRTMMGVSTAEMAAGVLEAGAQVIGVNCGFGSGEMVAIVRELRAAAPDAPILVNANAGQPVQTDNGIVYPETPEFMAANVPALLEAGASIIGGCCGTNPDHIRAIREAIRRALA